MKNKTQNKWMRRLNSLMAMLLLTVSFASPVSARILFEDDSFFNVNSEGIILDFNDNVDVGGITLNNRFKDRLKDLSKLLSFDNVIYYNMRPPMEYGNFKLS